MRRAEDYLLRFAMDSTPRSEASLERATDTFRKVWMSVQHLVLDSNSADARYCLEERDDFCLGYRLQKIRTAALAWRFALRWKLRLFAETIGRGPADRRFCSGNPNGMRLSVLHEESHLIIGYMATRHKLVLQNRKLQCTRPAAILRRRKSAPRRGMTTIGLPPSSLIPGASLILIDAESQ